MDNFANSSPSVIDERPKWLRAVILSQGIIAILTVVVSVIAWVSLRPMLIRRDALQAELLVKERQLASAQKQAEDAQRNADEARRSLETTAEGIHNALLALQQIDGFIEREKPFLRSADEAHFLVSERMLEDELNKSWSAMSVALPDAPKQLHQTPSNWITILSSSSDLQALRADEHTFSKKISKSKFSIYKSPNGFYALALVGDGSFTTAYRKTVELRNHEVAPGAYFADASTGWQAVN